MGKKHILSKEARKEAKKRAEYRRRKQKLMKRREEAKEAIRKRREKQKQKPKRKSWEKDLIGEEAIKAEATMLKTEKGEKSHFVQIRGAEKSEYEGYKKIKEEEIEKGKELGRYIERERKEWLKKHEEELIEQSAEIIKEMMKRGVEHRDLRGTNILVERVEGKEKSKPFLKVVDFDKASLTSKEGEGLKERETEKGKYRPDKEVEKISSAIGRSLVTNKSEEEKKIKKIRDKINKKLEEKINKEF